jgi:hypothetical protein
MIERVNEAELPEVIRTRMGELRACNNVASLTPIHAGDYGVLCILVPGEQVAEGGGWEQPTEPALLVIPNKRH